MLTDARRSRRSFLTTAGAVTAGLLLPALAAAPAAANTVPVHIPRDVWDEEQWIDVNITHQAAQAMIGRDVVRTAWVTTGKPGWDTPPGQFSIVRRVYNETMTSAALGIVDPNDQYELRDVMFTQYFTWYGHAFHLNYWRDDYVFGAQATSHGCVGMRYNDAEFFWRHIGLGSRIVIHY